MNIMQTAKINFEQGRKAGINAERLRVLEKIKKEITKIKSDERFSYPAATIDVNAPLALIQCDMEARVNELTKLKTQLEVKA